MPLLLSLLGNWRTWAVLGYLGLAAWGALQTKRLEWSQTENKAVTAAFEAFKVQVRAEGRLAQERAETQRKQDLQRAKEADDEAKKRYSSLDAQYVQYRMRQRAGNSATSSLLSAATAGTTSSSAICYTREKLDTEISGAIGRLRAGLADDAEPYDRAAVVARTCKEWAVTKDTR